MVFLGCNNPQKDITKKDKLNVLFIISDDLNCDLGIYGNKIVKTPHLDQLSQNGVVFKNAHYQYPLCSPYRASFMTRMYTKITNNNILIRSTIPESKRTKKPN